MYQQQTQQRMTVHDAARSLGISEDAVRMRVKRGTLEADKENGRLYVLLDLDPTNDPTGTNAAPELVDELRDQVRYLRSQLDQERQAHSEARRIIGGLVQRVPELESSSSSGTTEADLSSGPTRTPTNAGDGPEAPTRTATKPRPWWRKVFGS